MKLRLLSALLLGTGLLLSACTNTIKYDSKPVKPATKTNINLTEFQKATQSMVNSMLQSAPVLDVTRNQRPKLAVFGLVDFTGEDIDITALNNGMFSQIGQAARFNFADPAALTKADQAESPNRYDLLEDPAASRTITQAVGADYLLIGEVSNVIRSQPQQKEVWYRLSLKLVDERNGRFLWQERREFLKSQKKIIYGI
ncbi:MAG TPA: hypothetical protein VM553_12730 [Dongiaceae bacterium]|nr:hypothetical protein [Dongiaceae bacterium]